MIRALPAGHNRVLGFAASLVRALELIQTISA
jgi:hypothetical protein